MSGRPPAWRLATRALAWGRVAPGGALLVVALAGGPERLAAEPRVAREYDLKAAFLYNFAHFVDWPAEALGDPPATFVIGVLGDNPFGTSLDEVVANESVRGHPMAVRHLASAAEATGCQIVFVCRSEAERARPLLDALAGHPVLTVADLEHFAARGGMIEFVMSGGRLRLEINPQAARAARLVISSKLLRQADLVSGRVP